MQRRVLSLFLLLLFAVPVGISLSGCGKANASPFCNGSIGPRVGEPKSIVLTPTVGGISIGFSQIQSVTTPTAKDCHNDSVSLTALLYTTKDPNNPNAIPVADVNPSTGQLCAGTWNRNTPGGVPDFTFCTATNKPGVAELAASSNGASSNKVLVFVHPQITSITLGNPSTDCVNDPATNCPQYTASALTSAPPYDPNTCLSFGQSAQLVTRFFAGAQNITYSAGHATFTAQTPSLVSFEDTSGVATAVAPGTTVVTAAVSQSTSTGATAGLLSVCPPKSIVLSTGNSVNGNVVVNPNTNEPLTAMVTDINNVALTGLTLTVTSTNPIAIPATAASIAPVFPGTASVTAFCLPPSCNPSPYGNVGLQGTGRPVASNSVIATTPGSNSTRLWAGSLDSRFLVAMDLSTGVVGSPTILPYQPNSMIMTQNGQTIFLGSSQGLMTFGTATNSVGPSFLTLQGNLLTVSPDSITTVTSDPLRKTITIFNSSTSAVVSTFNGVGTRAAYTPDGSALYVLTDDNHLLVYSTFTSWQSYDLSAGGANDVAIAIPSVGAFIGGNTAINARSYCPNTTVTPTIFYPQAANTTVSAAVNDRMAATNDGIHLLDVRLPASGETPVMNDITFPASVSNDGAGGTRTFNNTLPIGDCPRSGIPPAFGTAVNTAVLTGIDAADITGIFLTTDAAQAFTTYTAAANAPSTGTKLPVYAPVASGAGTATNVTLADGATAPVTGVLSSDNKFFFAGTSGDNQIHVITRSTLTDSSQINPKLPSLSTAGGSAVPNLLVQYPRSVTNN